MAKLFGTDGVRGLANQVLTGDLAYQLGRSHGTWLKGRATRPKVLVARDSRLSADMLEAAYSAGLMACGCDVIACGLLPTPGVAFLVGRVQADGAAMISASHNPIEDNGIKLFGADGFKLDDEQSADLEALVGRHESLPRPLGVEVGRRLAEPTGEQLRDLYLEHLHSLAPCRLDGVRVVLDCAHGAACSVAESLFQRLGARLTVLSGEPDGERINVKCGSTDTAALARAVQQQGARLGLAFDGDADRCLATDEQGGYVDGDRMLLAFARWLQARGRLHQATVVATVMSNFGLEQALRDLNITLLRAQVGDRYVLDQMKATGAVLGGEQSGHIIFLDHATTGDGVLSAMLLACICVESGKSLSELVADLRPLPQRLVNVRTAHKDRLLEDTTIAAAVAQQEERLGTRGRLLIRPSGTEPLVRIMAEGPDEAELNEILDGLRDLIESRMGVGAT